MVQTPVIDDELSPHWLPWTSRAFVFGMMHPASNLYIAAFDFDLGISSHDPIGRIVVNLANLQPSTEYTLKYNLFPSSNVTDRNAAGSICIRVRVQYDDPKKALMQTLKPVPRMHVNVRKEKSLSVLRYTCFGENGEDNDFDLAVVRSYINEILGYKRAISYYFGDSFRSLMFWRGQVKVGRLFLPIHSVLFFLSASTLVERPYLFPSFLLLSVAWMLIANHLERTQHPSPWNRIPSVLHFIDILRNKPSDAVIERIEKYEGANDAAAYEKAWQERLEKDEAFAAQQSAMQQEIMDIGDETIQTKMESMIPLDLLVRLARYQAIVGRICKKFRMVKIVLTWEESYLSFWITASFLLVGLASLLLPWSFILLWTGRLVVWGLFGPHMKFIDLIMRANGDGTTDMLAKAMEKFQKESVGARIRRQEAVKLRDMKCLAFGKYITLVPSHNLSRHFDRPLPDSFARRYDSDADVKTASRGVPGQQLFGVVLPRTQNENERHESELISCAQAKELLDTQLRERVTTNGDEAEDGLSKSETTTESFSELNESSIEYCPDNDICNITGIGQESGLRRRNVRSGGVEESELKTYTSTLKGPEISSKSMKSTTESGFLPSGFGWFANTTATLSQVDEEREANGVEVVLSSSMMSYQDDGLLLDGRQRDDDSVTDTGSVVYFQPTNV